MPPNGSRTVSPSGVVNLMQRSTRPSLSCVGCQGRRCLELPVTRVKSKYVAGHPAARVRPLVAVLLPPTRHADGVRQQRGVGPAEPEQRAVIVAQVVVAMLPEGKRLDAGLGFQPVGAAEHFSDDSADLEGPLRVETEPDGLGPVNEQMEPSFEQVHVLVVRQLVLVGLVAQADIVRWVGEKVVQVCDCR